ncbi:hypothetical protein MSAN_01590700 [Mycena sanguinolenta]|uniref:F-box domain-containing protein n=1 Tax=Mycena sanguinolenta TaxID=230812 RepID=A0A8H7CXA2_9AGAR|nr:hypothetical protein MSAN_01590700 [Mycena sanguinolenta]
MLLDLSLELLQEIGSELTQIDQASLRTVCRDLNGAILPLFFSVLVLKINRNGLIKDTVQKLEVLGTGGTGWSLHAKTLRIIPVMQNHNIYIKTQLSNDELASLLAAALTALPRIQTFVHVHVDPKFWECAQAPIFYFLNSCENLRELELMDMPRTIDLSALHRVRGLRKFALKSIWDDSSARTISGTISTPGIAELISQNQLHTLRLEGPAEWAPLWRMLPFGTLHPIRRTHDEPRQSGAF